MVKRPDLSKRNRESRKERVKSVCPCGKEFYVLPRRIQSGAKYCSQKCYHRFTNKCRNKGKHWKVSEETKKKNSIRQLGEKNHNWKGGITEPRRSREEREWAKSVKKRDGFKCIICADTENIESHHLDAFKHFKEKRFLIENGVTLCIKHHRMFHKKYGKDGKNTKEQFDKFLSEELLDEIQSVEVKNTTNKKIYNLSIEGDRAYYANNILTHNTPKGTYVSPEQLKGWCKRKLGDEDAAFAVSKKIKEEGISPRPFIRPVLNQKLPMIIQGAFK